MKTSRSSRRRVVTTVAITAALGLVAGACGSDSDSDSDEPATTEAAEVADTAGEEAAESEGGTIAIVSPYYSAQPATKEVVDAFTARAEADGFDVSLVDTNNDLGAVNGEIETAVSQNADFVVLGMGDPQEFGPGLDAAVEAGVPVFGLDAGAVEGVTANITSDNEFLGRESAQAMIDAIGEGGKVAIIHFDPFEPVRLRGAAARVLFEEAGIEVIEDVQGDPADSTGFAKTTSLDWLNKYGDGEIDGIWAGWDASALGAFQATQEAGRTEVVVTGVDGQDFAREEVAKGENWIVTVRQDWEAIANKAVDTILELQAGTEPSSQTIVVEGEVLTADNA